MKIVNVILFQLLLFNVAFAQLKTSDVNYQQAEIIYGRKDGMAMTMFQVKPKKANGKAVVHVVAGSWFSSSSMVAPSIIASSALVDKGYTVFMVVVGSQPRYAIPDQVADVKRAVRYIRYNAKKLLVDPNHIGITGASAGGHLSLVVATADDLRDSTSRDPIDQVSARVQAVAVYYPPTDFFNWGMPGISFVNLKEAMIKARIYGAFDFKKWNDTTKTYDPVLDVNERIRIGKAISPINAVSSDDPPVFIIHGDADMTVPVQQSISFMAKYKEAHLPIELVIIKGAGHRWEDVKKESAKFLDWFDKYLK
jgi:acetyl esterase/lipase